MWTSFHTSQSGVLGKVSALQRVADDLDQEGVKFSRDWSAIHPQSKARRPARGKPVWPRMGCSSGPAEGSRAAWSNVRVRTNQLECCPHEQHSDMLQNQRSYRLSREPIQGEFAPFVVNRLRAKQAPVLTGRLASRPVDPGVVS